MEIEQAQAEITKHQNKFLQYYNLLISGNQKINLTAILNKHEVFVKHFLDSILPCEKIKFNAKIIDVGSGAGLPGLPIKIIRPDVQLTMIDALNKRVEFLIQTSKLLDVKTNCVHTRAEDYVTKEREKFDVAIARAVAPLNTLVEYLLPFVKIGGIVLAYKGSNATEELKLAQKAIELLGGKPVETLHYFLPDDMGERNIIVIKKIAHTPIGYPRGQNKPKLKPIV